MCAVPSIPGTAGVQGGKPMTSFHAPLVVACLVAVPFVGVRVATVRVARRQCLRSVNGALAESCIVSHRDGVADWVPGR